MDTGLYSGVAAMRSCERRLEAISSNLANIGTIGYKRQSSVTRAFELERSDRREMQVVTQFATDFRQGEIERTGGTYDLAIDGDGFFVVETESGPAYTRNGSFHIDSKGMLLTESGAPVQWKSSPARIDPAGAQVTIDGVGLVRQGDSPLGQLALVDFAAKQHLALDGHGLWRAPRGITPQASGAFIYQGARERSNVSSMDELVGMVTAQRSFENAATILRSIDSSYKRLNQPR
jgi:flagellar basal-body rod protein FlgF